MELGAQHAGCEWKVQGATVASRARASATSSIFAYCTERLHMSEGVAYHRIMAARAARRFPVIFELVAEGALHLAA
ncbi:MAG: hypothetical protein V2A73_02265, partial [Pseudomonadota bacterium]